MIHTNELSTMVSNEAFNEILDTFDFTYLKNGCWSYTGLAEKGISLVRLYKIKRFSNVNTNEGKQVITEEAAYYYVVCVVVNTGMMYGDSKEHSNDILAFTPDFVKNIYENVLDAIIPLKVFMQKYNIDIMNMFKNKRCDYCFDISRNHEQYMELLSRGKRLNPNFYEYKIYDNELEEDEVDVEIDVDDKIEEIEYETNKDTLYYKGKSLNINIYRKDKEVKTSDSNQYDFLRIEVQAKKRKLLSLAKNKKIKSYYMESPARQLQFMASDVVYREVMRYYLVKIAGEGNYVTKEFAFQLLDNTEQIKYDSKRKKIKELLETVEAYGNVDVVINKVKKGEITNLGSHKSVLRYIKQLEELGINPLLIPDDMVDSIEEVTLTHPDGTVIKTKMLLSLPALFDEYVKYLNRRKQEDYEYSQEEIEAVISQTRDSR